MSHAALMDATYRRQRLVYDATRKYYLLGRDHLIERLDPPEGGAVLEIACGTVAVTARDDLLLVLPNRPLRQIRYCVFGPYAQSGPDFLH